jgi:PAS domain S-box-containing protein
MKISKSYHEFDRVPVLTNMQLAGLFSKLTKWQKLSIAKRGAIAINIPLMCLVVSLGTHIYFRQFALGAEAKVEHIQNTLQESRSLPIDMLNAETGVRGYYVTRQLEFLEPYKYGIAQLPKTIARLKQLSAGNSEQLQRTNQLAALSEEKLAILKDRIEKVQRGEVTLGNNGSNLSLTEGRIVMDRFRQVLGEFSQQEERALGTNYRDLQWYRDLNILTIVLGVAISSLGSAFAAKLFKALATELEERQLRLQETSNLLGAIFKNMVDGAIAIDLDGTIEDCNDATLELFGYDRQQLIGHNWTKILGAESQNITPSAVPGKVEVSQLGHLWQTLGRRSNGDYFPIEISISNIERDDRQIAIVRDITTRQQFEAKLQARAEELSQLNLTLRRTNITLKDRNRELDRFAYVTSHDLKAPLRAIANLSDWIAEDLGNDLPPEQQQQLTLLRGRVERMEGLLNGLLDYSRIGRRHIPIELVDVRQLVDETIAKIAPPATFTIEIAPDLPKFRARRSLLKQVFHIPIENAIQHHPSSYGKVSIGCTDLGDYYEFAIADDGQGIDPQYHDRIYNIFQTLQARDTHESTGAGLAIFKKIVETEGGTIRLQSSLGQGATFYFSWPKQSLESIYTEEDWIT